MRTRLGLIMVPLFATGVCLMGSGCDNKTSTTGPVAATNANPAVSPGQPHMPDTTSQVDPDGADGDIFRNIPTGVVSNTGPSARR